MGLQSSYNSVYFVHCKVCFEAVKFVRNLLLKGVTIASGGVLPKIHPELLKKRKGNKLLSPDEMKAAKKVRVQAKKPAGMSKKESGKAPSTPRKSPGKKAKTPSKNASDSLGPGFTVLSEKTLFLGQTLCIVEGNIADIEVDAIVNPSSANLSLAGEVGSALKKAGGSAFEEEVKNLAKDKSPLEVANAAICAGHNFPAKFVIHVNSPNAAQKGALGKVETAVKNVLLLADEKNLKSIALPSIGSGAKGAVKSSIVQTTLKTISDYFVTVMASSLRQITFVVTKMEDIGVYTAELAKLDA